MAIEDTIQKLREELAKVPELTKEQRDVLTSQEIVSRVLPMMTAFAAGQVKANADELGGHTKMIAALAERMLQSPDTTDSLSVIWKNVIDGNYDATWTNDIILGLSDNWLFGPLLSFLFGAVHIGTSLINIYSVSQEKTRHAIAERIRPYLLDLGTLTRLAYRNPDDVNSVKAQMRKMGISDDKIDVYLDNAKTFLPIEVLARLWHRGEMNTNELDQSLRDLIFSPEDIERIKPALFEYPGVSDLVRFAVREVFSPELAEQLGLFSDMPEDFITEAQKAGLPEEYAKMFWGAHWEPVPVTQAFEMLHRGVIDINELKSLLRVNDIMPQYRDKLIEIAYQPITRVDLRRVYETGYIDEEELFNGYLDLGYNEKNANIITNWVIGEYGENRRELAKTDILGLYEKGYYSHSEAFDMLRSLKYNENACNELLIRVDIKIAEKERDVSIKRIKKLYLAREISLDGAKAKLSSLYISAQEINDIIVEWQLDQEQRIKRLSVTQVKEVFQVGVWGEGETLEYLYFLGYPEYEADTLLKLWTAQLSKEVV